MYDSEGFRSATLVCEKAVATALCAVRHCSLSGFRNPQSLLTSSANFVWVSAFAWLSESRSVTREQDPPRAACLF
jgi:hypothetical protein